MRKIPLVRLCVGKMGVSQFLQDSNAWRARALMEKPASLGRPLNPELRWRPSVQILKLQFVHLVKTFGLILASLFENGLWFGRLETLLSGEKNNLHMASSFALMAVSSAAPSAAWATMTSSVNSFVKLCGVLKAVDEQESAKFTCPFHGVGRAIVGCEHRKFCLRMLRRVSELQKASEEGT